MDDPTVVTDPTRFMPQVCKSKVSELMFSEQNIAALLHGISYGVYNSSGGDIVVGEQSRDELLTIMRSIYLSDSRNLPFNVLEQVRELNKKVLDYAVPLVESEARSYLRYRSEFEQVPRPHQNPLYTSRAGMRNSVEASQYDTFKFNGL